MFFACQECTDKLQLRSFSEKLLREDIPAKQYVRQFADWDRAFRAILELPYGNAKKLLVIDEFPYMCKDNAAIPSILQNLWDEVLKDANVMLILCGSAWRRRPWSCSDDVPADNRLRAGPFRPSPLLVSACRRCSCEPERPTASGQRSALFGTVTGSPLTSTSSPAGIMRYFRPSMTRISTR